MPFDFGQPIPIQTSFESSSGSNPSVNNVLVAGSDGIKTRTISVDENGKPEVNLHDGAGNALESALDFEGKRNLLSFITSHFEAASGSNVPIRSVLIGGSDGSKIRSIATDLNGQQKTNLHFGEGSPVPFLIDNAGMKNLPASMTHNIFLSSNNSSTANINAGQEFVGVSDLNLNADAIQVCIKCDQPVTITLEQSNDNTNWDFKTLYTLEANQADGRLITCVGSYTRIRVRNDGLSATTYFNLQCVLVPFTAILPQSLSDHGNLKTSLMEFGNGATDKLVNADKAIFGQAMTSSKLSLLNADFHLPLNNNDITTSVTGTGTVTQQNGYASIKTGTGVTSSAKIVSNRTLRYAVQREAHMAFPAAFTTPTHANSFQRHGLYDVDNGFFVGYSGLTFGVTIRKAGVDTFISKANFNRDKLNGTSGSHFVRDGIPEAINLAVLNDFRIRFGRSAKVNFEVLAPDGDWIAFHTVKLPNTSRAPAIESSVIPFTIEVSKTSADATDLEIVTTSVDVSIVDAPAIYGKEDVRGRKYVTANVSGQTADQNIYTVSPGRLLKVDSLIVSVSNSSLTTNGLLQIRDGNGGTILIPLTSPPSTNQSNAGNNLVLNPPTPLRFTNSVYADVVSGTLTYSVTIIGYEQEN